MSKHTSGPWTINHRKLGWELAGYVPIDGVNHSALAHVVWVMQDDEDAGRHSPECEANARLIAAAPDLLAALQALIMDHGGTLGCMRDDERAVAVRAAIAKATGKVERPEDVMDDAAAELRRLHGLLAEAQAAIRIQGVRYGDLAAENGKLRADAERYRWLRDTSDIGNPKHKIALHISDVQSDATLSAIDAAIDAARSEA